MTTEELPEQLAQIREDFLALEVRERLPRTSSGKVDRRALSAELVGVAGTAAAAERPGGPSAP